MIGFAMDTTCLNIAVAVRVAATETVAVETAVTKISFDGTGIVKSVPGTVTVFISCGICGIGGTEGALAGSGAGFSSFFGPFTPGGGLRSLGGTTRGTYDGTSALGISNIGTGMRTGSGIATSGIAQGSPK